MNDMDKQIALNIVLYSTSTASQVWAALLVFQVLLVRDQNARTSQAIEDIWKDAKFWWKGLIQNLRSTNGRDLGTRLEELGLDERTVARAETDIESFKKILKLTKEKQLIVSNNLHSEVDLRMRTVGGETFQHTMDALADRLLEAERKRPNPIWAFLTGIFAIMLNMWALFALRSFLSDGCLGAGFIAVFNFVILVLFVLQMLPSLNC